jgi:hypothetical protein
MSGRLDFIDFAVVVIAERYADGEVTEKEASAAKRSARRSAKRRDQGGSKYVSRAVAWVEARSQVKALSWAPPWAGIPAPADADEHAAARVVAAHVLRDLFGNPFRPAPLDPAVLIWKDGTIPRLAQVIYEERELPSGHLDRDGLAILGDALEDSGCSDTDILGHCRGPGPHVRGCWVIDLLLGKV